MNALILRCFLATLAFAQGLHASSTLGLNGAAARGGFQLQWAADADAAAYVVRKQVRGQWEQLGALPGTATAFADTASTRGNASEYQVVKTLRNGSTAASYLRGGENVATPENMGRVLLVVEQSQAASARPELQTFANDLVGSGWTPLQVTVSAGQSVASVKAIIKAEHARSPLTSVILIGHVPVPYSGNLNPDGHGDHRGAWPADAYYADLDGAWTDAEVSNSTANKKWNWNVPGDGKFDQSTLPSDVELAVGRIDFSNLTAFANKSPSLNETDLLKRYLRKNHAFRHGLLRVDRAALVMDKFGQRGRENFAGGAWRNFAPLVGAQAVSTSAPGEFFTKTKSQSYLLSYATGGGDFYTLDGVGSSDDFARQPVNSVVAMFFGSYFGDWDNESNFLRAALAGDGATLAVMWAGRPQWFLHRLGVGGTLGESTLLSQNNPGENGYIDAGFGGRGTHMALLGDPTLQLYPTQPPANVRLEGTTLRWQSAGDAEAYSVYQLRGGALQRLGENVQPLSFTVPDPAGVYAVRAQRTERTPSGSFRGLSQAIFKNGSSAQALPPSVAVPAALAPAPASGGSFGQSAVEEAEVLGAPSAGAPPTPIRLSGTPVLPTQVNLRWVDRSVNETGFIIQRAEETSRFATIGAAPADASAFSSTRLRPGTPYRFRIAATNSAGQSSYSSEIVITTLPGESRPQLVEIDNPQIVKHREETRIKANREGPSNDYSTARRLARSGVTTTRPNSTTNNLIPVSRTPGVTLPRDLTFTNDNQFAARTNALPNTGNTNQGAVFGGIPYIPPFYNGGGFDMGMSPTTGGYVSGARPPMPGDVAPSVINASSANSQAVTTNRPRPTLIAATAPTTNAVTPTKGLTLLATGVTQRTNLSVRSSVPTPSGKGTAASSQTGSARGESFAAVKKQRETKQGRRAAEPQPSQTAATGNTPARDTAARSDSNTPSEENPKDEHVQLLPGEFLRRVRVRALDMNPTPGLAGGANDATGDDDAASLIPIDVLEDV